MRPILILLIVLVLAATVSAQTREDYLRLVENTDQCVGECHTTYEVCNPTSAPKMLTDDLSVRFAGATNKLARHVIEKVSDVDVRSAPERTERLTAANGRLAPGACAMIRINSRHVPTTENGGIDNIITYAGMSFDEYAWWHWNWSNKKRLNITYYGNTSFPGARQELIKINLSDLCGSPSACNVNYTDVRLVDDNTGEEITYELVAADGTYDNPQFLRAYLNTSTDAPYVFRNYSIYFNNSVSTTSTQNINGIRRSNSTALYPGLRHYYPLNLDPNDYVGSLNGTNYSGAWTSNISIAGGSRYFDGGTNAKIKLNDADEWDAAQTWLVWFKPTNFASQSELIQRWDVGVNQGKYVLDQIGSDLYLSTSIGGACTPTISNLTSYHNESGWFALGFSISGGNRKLLVNGQTVESCSGDGLGVESLPVYIGEHVFGGAAPPEGYIDDVMMFDTAYSEISWLRHPANVTLLSTAYNNTPSGSLNESAARVALDRAINLTLPLATRYTDLKVLLGNLSGSQRLIRFDKVYEYKGQYWGFNYITTGESVQTPPNVSRTFYAVEYQTGDVDDVAYYVSSLINSTR